MTEKLDFDSGYIFAPQFIDSGYFSPQDKKIYDETIDLYPNLDDRFKQLGEDLRKGFKRLPPALPTRIQRTKFDPKVGSSSLSRRRF